MNEPLPIEVDVLVVGAGQAGLGAAYWLTRQPGLRVLVLDRASVGQSWLDRWDSLVLFTPRRFSSLPGLRFPGGPTRCPTRTEMADYLRTYVEHHGLPVRTGVDVQRLTAAGDGFIVETRREHGGVAGRGRDRAVPLQARPCCCRGPVAGGLPAALLRLPLARRRATGRRTRRGRWQLGGAARVELSDTRTA
jgi:putative flavoprotein involved in K+ transport